MSQIPIFDNSHVKSTVEAPSRSHIGMVLPSLGGGGAEKIVLTLARCLIDRGYHVDLVLLKFRGLYRNEIPDGITLYGPRDRSMNRDFLLYCRARGIQVQMLRIDPLHTIRTWNSLRQVWPELQIRWRYARAALCVARYLEEANPHLLFAALPVANDASAFGIEVAGHSLPLVVSIRNNAELAYSRKYTATARALTRRASAVVAISKGLASEVVLTLEADAERVHTIYNLIPVADIQRLGEEEVGHPWFGTGEPPVILTVLRDAPQKDWATLIAAFGQVCRKVRARIAILGNLSEKYQEKM